MEKDGKVLLDLGLVPDSLAELPMPFRRRNLPR
jgi:hypothetical protein